MSREGADGEDRLKATLTRPAELQCQEMVGGRGGAESADGRGLCEACVLSGVLAVDVRFISMRFGF